MDRQEKLKLASEKTWKESLTNEEKVAHQTAISLFDKFVKPKRAIGMCYRLTFFLHEYLKTEYKISAVPVVGYVWDKQTPIMASHAWVEINGRKTDLSLAYTGSKAQPSGRALSLDRPIKGGWAYDYRLEQDEAALRAMQSFMEDPLTATMVRYKNREHEAMLSLADNTSAIRAYLDRASDGFTYERISTLIRA